MFFVPTEEEKFLFYDAPDDFITHLFDIYDANVKIKIITV